MQTKITVDVFLMLVAVWYTHAATSQRSLNSKTQSSSGNTGVTNLTGYITRKTSASSTNAIHPATVNTSNKDNASTIYYLNSTGISFTDNISRGVKTSNTVITSSLNQTNDTMTTSTSSSTNSTPTSESENSLNKTDTVNATNSTEYSTLGSRSFRRTNSSDYSELDMPYISNFTNTTSYLEPLISTNASEVNTTTTNITHAITTKSSNALDVPILSTTNLTSSKHESDTTISGISVPINHSTSDSENTTSSTTITDNSTLIGSERISENIDSTNLNKSADIYSSSSIYSSNLTSNSIPEPLAENPMILKDYTHHANYSVYEVSSNTTNSNDPTESFMAITEYSPETLSNSSTINVTNLSSSNNTGQNESKMDLGTTTVVEPTTITNWNVNEDAKILLSSRMQNVPTDVDNVTNAKSTATDTEDSTPNSNKIDSIIMDKSKDLETLYSNDLSGIREVADPRNTNNNTKTVSNTITSNYTNDDQFVKTIITKKLTIVVGDNSTKCKQYSIILVITNITTVNNITEDTVESNNTDTAITIIGTNTTIVTISINGNNTIIRTTKVNTTDDIVLRSIDDNDSRTIPLTPETDIQVPMRNSFVTDNTTTSDITNATIETDNATTTELSNPTIVITSGGGEKTEDTTISSEITS